MIYVDWEWSACNLLWAMPAFIHRLVRCITGLYLVRIHFVFTGMVAYTWSAEYPIETGDYYEYIVK